MYRTVIEIYKMLMTTAVMEGYFRIISICALSIWKGGEHEGNCATIFQLFAGKTATKEMVTKKTLEYMQESDV